MKPSPVAGWLRETRLRHVMPNGEPWTQEHLLTRMEDEVGWAPHRPNYSRYEQGKSIPGREILARFITFWAGHDEPGPDLTPVAVEPEPDLAAAITALTQELRAARLEREETQERLRALEAAVALLAGRDDPAPPRRTAPQESAG